MSSTKWFDHMRIAFPDWHVFDSSGNNFSIVRNFPTNEGGQIMIGVLAQVRLSHFDYFNVSQRVSSLPSALFME